MNWRGDGSNAGSREFTLKEDTKNTTRSQAERTGQLESPSAQGEAEAGGSKGRAWPINRRGGHYSSAHRGNIPGSPGHQ